MATRKAGAARIMKSRADASAGPDTRRPAAVNRHAKARRATKHSIQGDGGGEATAKKRKPGKVIRDSFTMPVADYELLGVLKKRCIGLGVAIKKSELLRAGLAALERLPDESLARVVAEVETVKTGRPPGKKKRKKRKKKKMKNRVKNRKNKP